MMELDRGGGWFNKITGGEGAADKNKYKQKFLDNQVGGAYSNNVTSKETKQTKLAEGILSKIGEQTSNKKSPPIRQQQHNQFPAKATTQTNLYKLKL